MKKLTMLVIICFACLFTLIGCVTPADAGGQDVSMIEQAEEDVVVNEPMSEKPNTEQAKPGPAAGGPPGPPPSYNHETEFSVITLGSGNPIPNQDRGSACTIIQYKGKYYLLDTGNGANNTMANFGYAFSDIRAILFTHLHADHVTDFMDIMINRWMTGGKELEIIGPPRSGDLYKFMMSFFADDLIYRKYRGLKTGVTDSGMFTDVNVTELIGINEFDLDGMKVSTQVLTHTQYNLGYRFEVDGKSIVVSGDTSYDEDLVILAKDADILIMDTSTKSPSQPNNEAAAFTDDSIEKPEPIYEYSGNFNVDPHMGIADVATLAQKANVKTVVITHLPPGPIDMESIRQQFLDAGYTGNVIEGTDGLEINL